MKKKLLAAIMSLCLCFAVPIGVEAAITTDDGYTFSDYNYITPGRYAIMNGTQVPIVFDFVENAKNLTPAQEQTLADYNAFFSPNGDSSYDYKTRIEEYIMNVLGKNVIATTYDNSVFVGTFVLPDGVTVPADGMDAHITADYGVGTRLFAMQLRDDGTWEEISAQVPTDGIMEMKIYSTNPVYLLVLGEENTNTDTRAEATATINGQTVHFNMYMDPFASCTPVQNQKLQEMFAKIGEAGAASGIDVNNIKSEEEMIAYNTATYAGVLKEYAGVDASKVYFGCPLDIQNTPALDLSAGVAITFPAPDIKTGDTVVVLHLKADGVWEKIPATAGESSITGTFTSLSPVYYFKVDAAASTNAPTENHYHNFATLVVEPTETTWGYTTYYCSCGYEYHDNYVAPLSGAAATVTSPKTGESAMPFVMAVAALGAIGGVAVIAGRKYSAR